MLMPPRVFLTQAVLPEAARPLIFGIAGAFPSAKLRALEVRPHPPQDNTCTHQANVRHEESGERRRHLARNEPLLGLSS